MNNPGTGLPCCCWDMVVLVWWGKLYSSDSLLLWQITLLSERLVLGTQPMLCGHLGNTSKLYIYTCVYICIYIYISFLPVDIFPLLNFFLLTGWISLLRLRYTLKHCHRSLLHHQKRVCSPRPPGNRSFYLNLSSGLGSWRGGKGGNQEPVDFVFSQIIINLSKPSENLGNVFFPSWKSGKKKF